MRVIGYLRVSTEGQIEGFGLDAQREVIQNYCEENGHDIIRWVSDEAESGAKFRPGFDEIVFGSVENPPYEAVVVAKSDRVARDINIYYYYKGALKRKNIELISASECFGEDNIQAKILEMFTQICAEMERENITHRMSAGRKIKGSAGGYAGGRPPFGYRAVSGGLVVNEEEAAVVRLAFVLRKNHTIRKTAELINLNHSRNGKPISHSTIQVILNNEQFYRGYYRYGTGEWVKGQHEAILK